MNYLVGIALVFALMAGGIAVDRLYRRFAARNPERGPFRDKDARCGCCAVKDNCADQTCSTGTH
jgi:hypothetical protein